MRNKPRYESGIISESGEVDRYCLPSTYIGIDLIKQTVVAVVRFCAVNCYCPTAFLRRL